MIMFVWLTVPAVNLQIGLLLFICRSLCAQSPKKALLSPVNPEVAFGEALEVKCAIQEEGLTSYDLSFHQERCRRAFPASSHFTETRSSPTTATLLIRNVTRGMILNCCDRDGSKLDAILVRVGYKPGPFSITSVTADNWGILTVLWSDHEWPDAGSITHYRTTTTAYWKADEEADYHLCLNQNRTSCWFSLSNNNVDDAKYFTIKVNSTNGLGNFTTPPMVVQMADIIKPRAVREMTLQRSGSDWLEVKWTSPVLQSKGLLYIINASALFIDKPRVQMIISEDTVIIQNITCLLPGTQWHLTIRARANQGRFWSDPKSIYGTTRESVPIGFPVTTRGGFDIIYSSDSKRHIKLYWQQMPLHLRGGNITGYKIDVSTRVPSGNQQIEVPAHNCCQHELSLALNETYNISVTARTSVGYNAGLRPQAQIIVPSQTFLELQRPKNVTAIVTDNNVITVTWSVKKGTNYTGYWCPSRHGNSCDDTVNWVRDIVSPWTVTSLSGAADPRLFRVGISSDQRTSSSGITWSDCVYPLTGRATSLKVFRMLVIGGVHFQLDASDVCSDGGGFVYAYKITYCVTQGIHCLDEPVTLMVPRVGRNVTWEVGDLQEDKKYTFTIHSFTATGLSTSSTTLTFIIPQAGTINVKENLTTIPIAIFIAATFLVIGIASCFKFPLMPANRPIAWSVRFHRSTAHQSPMGTE